VGREGDELAGAVVGELLEVKACASEGFGERLREVGGRGCSLQPPGNPVQSCSGGGRKISVTGGGSSSSSSAGTGGGRSSSSS